MKQTISAIIMFLLARSSPTPAPVRLGLAEHSSIESRRLSQGFAPGSHRRQECFEASRRNRIVYPGINKSFIAMSLLKTALEIDRRNESRRMECMNPSALMLS